MAQLAHVSHDTAHKVRRIVQEADESSKEALRQGSRSIHAVHTSLPRRRPASRTKAAATSAVTSPTPVSPSPVELPPQLRMAQRLIDLAEGMLEELAAWRRQSPHDAVVHAFGQMEKHLTEIKDYFGKKFQAMHASFATGNIAAATPRPTDNAGTERAGGDRSHDLQAEEVEATVLAGAHRVAPASMGPGVSTQYPDDTERTTPPPDDAPEAPAAGAAETFSSERHDSAPAPATDVTSAEADTHEATTPAITATTTPGTESSGTQAQETPEATLPQACESSSEGGDQVWQGGHDEAGAASTGVAGAQSGHKPGGSTGATSKRDPHLDSLRRQFCNKIEEVAGPRMGIKYDRARAQEGGCPDTRWKRCMEC